jgi:hypothetical protein
MDHRFYLVIAISEDPCGGMGISGREWWAVRPPSLAGQLHSDHRYYSVIAISEDPCGGMGISGREWLAVGPSSLASQLPQ